jgi:hypothetical protein
VPLHEILVHLQKRLFPADQRQDAELGKSGTKSSEKLRSWTGEKGIYSRLFDHPTTISLDNPWLFFNVEQLADEAWYVRQVKDGVQVVICHPKLVETGLDLLDFPTIIFYESGYSLHTLRQASRRSWRIGQARNVRVKFFCYEGTMQGSCLRLMGKKLLVALTMEGKFAGEGLQSIDEDDDMLSAMARELVEKNGIGDSADAVWRSLNKEHRKLFPTVQPGALDNGESSVATAAEDKSEATELIEAAITTGPVLVFGQSSNELRSSRRRPRAAIPEQPSLFNWN